MRRPSFTRQLTAWTSPLAVIVLCGTVSGGALRSAGGASVPLVPANNVRLVAAVRDAVDEAGRPEATPSVPQESFSVAFDRANRLYEQGQYTNAVTAYERLLASGRVSAALYFNLGNACFKAGQVGRAIFNYRLAQRLSPRDPDILANLQFARASVPGASPRDQPRWQRWVQRVALDEATLVATGAVWLWLGLLITRQLWPQTRPGLRGWTALAGGLAGLAVVWLALTIYSRAANATAIVVARDGVVRYGPLTESQSYFTARDGMELTVLDEKGGWLQVMDPNQRVGWIEAPKVVVLPPEWERAGKQSPTAAPSVQL